MNLKLVDRPRALFDIGLKLLALRHDAMALDEDTLSYAMDKAMKEVDRLLLEHMEDVVCSTDARCVPDEWLQTG